MKSKTYALMLLLLVVSAVWMAASNSSAKDKNLESFRSEVNAKFQNIPLDANVTIQVKKGFDLLLVFSGPYGIDRNNSKLKGLIDGVTIKKMEAAVSDDSAFHVLYVYEGKVAYHDRWKSPPVVFNDLHIVQITAKSKAVEFDVKKGVLRKTNVIEK